MTNYTIPLRLISFIIFEWNDPWKGIPSRHSGREWMMDGDYPLLYQGDDLFPFLLIFTSFFLSFSTTGLSVWTVPAWGGCRRWKQIPGSSPPHGHATSRLSWRWRDFPGPGHLSLWRSRVRGTCALCRDGWPIIHFLFGKDVLYYYHTIHRSITGLKRWWKKERKKKKDGNLFTGGCGFDILGVLRLGRRVIGAAQQWPDDASEMMRDPFADEVLDVGVSLLVRIGPVGHQTAPKAPLILFVVVRARLLTVGTGTCRVSQNANIQILKKKKKNNK